MDLKLLSKQLGTICLLIGVAMAFSLPWAFSDLGRRNKIVPLQEFESNGFWSLFISMILCGIVGFTFRWCGRKATGHLFRKEAIAVVGLSWVMATVLGGLPYLLCSTYRSSSVRLFDFDSPPQVFAFERMVWGQWISKSELTAEQYELLDQLVGANAHGVSIDDLIQTNPNAAEILDELTEDTDWRACVLTPQERSEDSLERHDNYRIRWVRTSIADALFESQSGFSTTGATVFSDLEDPAIIPHCLLFWRSSTHFLGGLGIIVLFVVLLGQGSAGKAMMKAELTGPSQENVQARMQLNAWLFAMIYCGLNLFLTLILKFGFRMTWFDSLCHAFGTMATGGFSTYNSSVAHFDSPWLDYVLVLFMILAGTNFTLLFLVARGQYKRLLNDSELHVFLAIILVVTILMIVSGMFHGDFVGEQPDANPKTFVSQMIDSVRFSLFQVVSVVTTTGFATHDFDQWSDFGRGILFTLMFVGGCAGSTGGGLKVIRHILFVKTLRLELERSFRPNVVRPITLAGNPLEDQDLGRNTLVYFAFILLIFISSWIFLISIEPDTTWGGDAGHKLLDSATAVSATLNNIGPGLGTVGPKQNFGHFSSPAKILFTWLMMLGRVEVFAILVLFVPSFWRQH